MLTNDSIKIKYLCDHIVYAETVAKWCYEEFVVGIRNDLSYADVLATMNKCYKQELPIRLIALINDKCVGTVSIVVNDLRCRTYTPWLAALYVDSDFRNQRIGRILIASVQSIVRQSGYTELFLRTEHASDYYRKLGWTFIETCDDSFGLKPDVFRLDVM